MGACLECGGEGFSNAFVFCVNCLDVAVHRYCLAKLPVTFDEFVPWFCEDCQNIANQTEQTFVLPQKGDELRLEHFKAINLTVELKISDFCSEKIAMEHVCDDGSSQQCQKTCSAHDLTSGMPFECSSPCNAEPKKVVEDKALVADVKEPQCQTRLPVCPRSRHTTNDFSSPVVLVNGFCSTEENKEMELGEKTSLVCRSGCESYEEVSQPANGSLSNTSYNKFTGCAQPFIDPIWRGTFSIIDKDIDRFDGFVAHLSNKACLKVLEEAKLFPSVLHFEMLPKAQAWPKSFGRSEPSDDNIALYFFPLDKSCERKFDYLVEVMSNKELSLRTTVKNAELLIFSSTELPLLHWRFKGKYFMWGVFRGKQKSRSVVEYPIIQASDNESVSS